MLFKTFTIERISTKKCLKFVDFHLLSFIVILRLARKILLLELKRNMCWHSWGKRKNSVTARHAAYQFMFGSSVDRQKGWFRVMANSQKRGCRYLVGDTRTHCWPEAGHRVRRICVWTASFWSRKTQGLWDPIVKKIMFSFLYIFCYSHIFLISSTMCLLKGG